MSHETYPGSNGYGANHTDAGSTLSPIYSQIEQLDKRLETTYSAFLSLQQKIHPVLSVETDQAKGPIPCEVGSSPLHDRLISLNSKASAFARAVAETSDRVTV